MSLQSEMKLFGGSDAVALRQHFGKKIVELEDEKRTVQQERDRLLAEVENLAANNDGQTQKFQDIHTQKLKALEAQDVEHHNVVNDMMMARDYLSPALSCSSPFLVQFL
ncbi:Kinesin-like protein KIN-4A [Camellia lanceoleosa]|uniref:Kinesin-like protein KIN-4A n=1 Tax=Camellia lanceoleosa TaxID=1840588 RepID=A0ACC0FGA4_9ERIC|nr:Kinesin-like protein KIN-4A [Camellia lanceoleosa]